MMWSDPRVIEAWKLLPDYLGAHIRVSAASLALGIVISLPLALAARHRPVLRGALLAFASAAQTIPGLALLALFYPLLLILSALSERWFGLSFSAFGFLPAMLALAIYSMLPILRNTVTGLTGVDPALREAAEAVGMTPRQSLAIVEWPLALPVIMAGIRTAAVWVIGTATLSTPIGQASLGNYIFMGLQTQNWVFVLFGSVAAAILALTVDQLLGLMEAGVKRRSRARLLFGGGALVLLLIAAVTPVLAPARTSYIVGAKTFGESYVLASLVSQRLDAAGLPARQREGLGSSVIFNALAANEMDVYVDYSGTLWSNLLHRTETPPRDQLIANLKSILAEKYNVTLLGELGFENAYALVMPRSRAEAMGIHTIADLARHSSALSIAGDYEFFSRPEWTALKSTYQLNFKTQRQMQPDFMYAAVASGEVDVIAGYTSDGLIAKYDLVTLDDPQHIIPPYDAVLLAAPRRASDDKMQAALQPLFNHITIDTMREANLRVSSGQSPDEVARWLWNGITTR